MWTGKNELVDARQSTSDERASSVQCSHDLLLPCRSRILQTTPRTRKYHIMDVQGRLKFLIVMAASDGGLSEEELAMLSQRARAWGISLDEFEQIVNDATGDDIELAIPNSQEERLSLLTELVRMMGADGKLHQNEKELFALIAARMEISEADVNRAIDIATES